MERIPPYFHNFDNTHCLQCALRSALEYFDPEKTWTWKELEELSFKREGQGTWHMGFLSQLGKHGYDVVCIENFNLQKYIANPAEYLKEGRSAESYAYTMRTMDHPHEIACSKLLLEAESQGLAELHYRNSTAEDIRAYLKEGFLIVLWVNTSKLWQHGTFSGHFVLVYDLDGDDCVRIHDNGGLSAGEPVGMSAMKMNVDFLVEAGTDGKKTGGFYALRPTQTGSQTPLKTPRNKAVGV